MSVHRRVSILWSSNRLHADAGDGGGRSKERNVENGHPNGGSNGHAASQLTDERASRVRVNGTNQEQEAPESGVVARVGSWVSKRRARVTIGWVLLLIVITLLSSGAGTRYVNSLTLHGTDSQRATDVLQRNFPAQAGDADQIVLDARQGSLTDGPIQARVTDTLSKVAQLPHVTGVVSPYSAAGARAISSDKRVAFATVSFDRSASDLPTGAINRVISVAERGRSPQLQVELGGPAIEQTQKPTLGAATAVGLLAAIIVLLVTFGSLVAAGLPIVTALLGLGTALGLAALASHFVDTPSFATQLAALIGLGVGIDYALFIVTRFRDNYRRSGDLQGAIDGAMEHAGRTVAFAAITVVTGLLSLFVLGQSLLYGVAISAALAVLLTMLAALTMLPVLLARFGERIARRRRDARKTGAGTGRFWPRWAALIQRHPWAGLFAGLVIMLALAAPVLGLRLGTSDAGNDPTTTTTRAAYDLVAKGFGPGSNGPLQVVASLPRPDDTPAVTRITDTLAATGNVASVAPPHTSADGRTVAFDVYPRTAPQAQASTDLVTTLRSDRLPPVARQTGATILVGGEQASSVDFTHVLSQKLPIFIGIVVGLSALLLLVLFRSVVIPIQAAVMNLLSIASALGVTAAVFQWGWLGGVFNSTAGPIEAYIPVVVFAIVFGLSMDYEMFLVSRIREAWTERRDASRAVYNGFASTGRVITAAATIMLVVFLSFVTGDQRVVKVFGLALASAVFLDAFVVRSLLLPALLQLLGRHTWWLPPFLDRRLPHVAVEPEPDALASAESPGSKQPSLDAVTR
jgi:RND superfamily putative drug exporter